MNLTRLQTFATVVRLGTFAAAADALSFTPSAVSQQMSKLEAELGVALLLRGASGPGKQVELTEAGRRLHAHAIAISAAVLGAREDLEGLRGARRDRLRVGAEAAVGAALLPRALRGLRERLPALRVEVVEGDGEDLLRRGLDLVLCSRAPDDPDVVPAAVARGPMLVALPPGHPLAAHAAVAPAALAAEPVLGGPGSSWDVAHPLALIALVRAGEGVAVVAPAVPGDGVELRPLPAAAPWELLALRRRERPALAGMALLEELRAVAATHPHLRPATAVPLPLAA